MAKLTIVINAPSRVRLAKIYILLRDLIEYFGLEEDITIDLDGQQG